MNLYEYALILLCLVIVFLPIKYDPTTWVQKFVEYTRTDRKTPLWK